MLKKLSVLLLSTSFVVGCFREAPYGGTDTPLVQSNSVHFSYTLNSQQTDLLSSSVRHIRLYAFDAATKLLADVIDVGAEDIARGSVGIDHLPDGRYTFVAWGSDGDDLTRHFSAVQMINPAAGNHTEVQIGQTSIDHKFMVLDCEDVGSGVQHGDVTPADGDFDHLFYAKAENVALTAGANQTVELDFIRNTKTLNVTVAGLQNLPGGSARADLSDAPVRVFLVGKNGRVRWNNTIDDHAPAVRYEPTDGAVNGNSMNAAIRTMRLDVDRHTTDPVLLYVQNAATGADVIEPMDVVGAIMQTKTATGASVYRNQGDIDKADEFDVKISLSNDMAVTITIDGWEIETPNAEF